MNGTNVVPPKKQNEKARASFEPPMNTDEHRLKADKEKAYKHMHCSFFIMSLSVFIGVHRWLKILFSGADVLHSVQGRGGAHAAPIGLILFPFRLDVHPGRSYVLLSCPCAVAALEGVL